MYLFANFISIIETYLLGSITISHNGRRYGSVAAESRWCVFLQSLCGAGLCGYCIILALAKTVTPGGSPPTAPGAARTAVYRAVLFSQKILAVRKAMTYTELLCAETIYINALIASLISLSVESLLYPLIILRIILFSSRIKKTGTPEI